MNTPSTLITDSVIHACKLASDATVWMDLHPEPVAAWMLQVADALLQQRPQLIQTAAAETHLFPSELEPELLRTALNLRSFAVLASRRETVGEYKGRENFGTNLQRSLRLVHVPLGPVAVIGASNFPLAYGYLGTDATSALAAGCPVIVKSHPLQPRTYALQAQIARQAADRLGLPAGVLQLLEGPVESTLERGTALVIHPSIRAVGFTGSLQGGRALERLAQQRTVPIPFFGELGSVNPQLILPGALNTEGRVIARTLTQSLIARAGQQCTCPGLWIILNPEANVQTLEAFLSSARDVLATAPARRLLSPAIARAFRNTCQSWLATPGVTLVFAPDFTTGIRSQDANDPVQPCLALADAQTVRSNPRLLEENFGPAALIVNCQSPREVEELLQAIGGTLVASLWHGDCEPPDNWPRLLTHIAGRVVLQGVPTGVQVSPLMQHGGPFPASTRPESSAVGDRAVTRWQRPVALQGWPDCTIKRKDA